MSRGAPSPRLGELLLQRQHIGAAELETALGYQIAHGGRLGAILVRMGSLSDDTLYALLADQLDMPLVDATTVPESELEAGLAAWGFSGEWWRRQGALAWVDAQGVRHVGAAVPQDVDLRESLAAAAGAKSIVWHFILPAGLDYWQHRLARDDAAVHELDARTLRELAEDAPVVAFVM